MSIRVNNPPINPQCCTAGVDPCPKCRALAKKRKKKSRTHNLYDEEPLSANIEPLELTTINWDDEEEDDDVLVDEIEDDEDDDDDDSELDEDEEDEEDEEEEEEDEDDEEDRFSGNHRRIKPLELPTMNWNQPKK